MGWTVRDRIPVGTRFSALPDRPWAPPSLLYNGYRVFPGSKVWQRRAAGHSPPSSAAVMEELSYTSTHPLGHTGPVTGSINLYLSFHILFYYRKLIKNIPKFIYNNRALQSIWCSVPWYIFHTSFTYLITCSMVQSPSWEANWFAASQEIPRISRNPKVHYRTHKRPTPVSILGQPNPFHIPTSHLLEIQPNIIHPSTPRSPQWSRSLRFPQHDPIHPLTSPIRATCPAHLIPHYSLKIITLHLYL